MGDDIRIGEPPAPPPPARSGMLIAVGAGLVLLAAGAAWLMGAFRDPSDYDTTTIALPSTTTTTVGTTSTTSALSDRLHRARTFWTALGAGDAAAATAVVADPDPGAVDLIAFVAAFSPGLTVQQCGEFDADTIDCLVRVTNEDLLAVGGVGGTGRLRVSDDGRFDVPAAVANAAARLSLHALNLHTQEVQSTCPLTDAPQVPGLAIVGSPTGWCGAYLARLIPEYLYTDVSTTTTTVAGAYDRAALDYFGEVAGAAEFGENGGVLHRWDEDLRIAVYGSPTPDDRAALAGVVDDLNGLISTIEVSIVEADPNVEIHFAPVEEFPTLEPNYVAGNMGYVYVWWDGEGRIYSGRVLISTTGLTPQERAHVIREELTQGLGLLNDSWLYPDSVFYQGWTEVGQYAPLDRLVIEMLYRPDLEAGMSIDEALGILAALQG
jgi:hypothetical protein